MTGPGTAGPFETERQARETPASRHAYSLMAPGNPRPAAPPALSILMDACIAAGVELGAYDRRIVEWLAGYEPAMCAVIAGLITRAAGRRDGTPGSGPEAA